jgi:hypothetical protein
VTCARNLGLVVRVRMMGSEWDRQAKTDACLVPLCPLASMVPCALAVICLVAA